MGTSTLRFSRSFKGTGSLLPSRVRMLEPEIREEWSKGSVSSPSLLIVWTRLKNPPLTVWLMRYKNSNLLGYQEILLSSFRYIAVTANVITVMTVKIINGSRYGYCIHIQPESIFGKWSWGRASQPPMTALSIQRGRLLIFSVSEKYQIIIPKRSSKCPRNMHQSKCVCGIGMICNLGDNTLYDTYNQLKLSHVLSIIKRCLTFIAVKCAKNTTAEKDVDKVPGFQGYYYTWQPTPRKSVKVQKTYWRSPESAFQVIVLVSFQCGPTFESRTWQSPGMIIDE